MNASATLKKITKRVNYYYSLLFFVLLSLTNPAFAALGGGGGCGGGGTTLASLADNVTKTFSSFVYLITGGAYVVGFALAMVGILKLKAHKDNPTQIPISTGLALIFVGSALVFLPTLLGVGISTIFGDAASGEVSASGTDKLIMQ